MLDYNLLTGTVIIPTGIIIIHVYTSISLVDNDILLYGNYMLLRPWYTYIIALKHNFKILLTQIFNHY